MKQNPTPRPRIYDLYWYFAAERHAIFQRRVEGKPAPWSSDPILQEYKFCSVYRAADRVSQYLIRDIAASTSVGTLDDKLFQIIAFRMFSKTETWETLKTLIGHPPTIQTLKDGSFRQAVEKTLKLNKKLYTGAFILCANKAFGHSKKYLNHIALFEQMFVRDSLAPKLRNAKSLQGVYELLHEYPLIGDFMAYQIAIDLNYSDQINFSENDFCQTGPGALRGIKKAFVDFGSYTPNEIVFWMVEKQEAEFKRLGFAFKGLWGRPLHAIDCQGLFCELDKYCRVAAPELQSQRQRIKARFAPTANSFRLFFPPKWKINSKIPSKNVLGTHRPTENRPERRQASFQLSI